ncbi:MAG: methyltransferase domain-containing protein [Ignavibacteria bacterium]|nr:methyltransferase domain-containing protein [Ignavibacteria bacterium]
MANKDYVLGVSDYELNRLKFQHGVWKEITDTFLDKLDITNGSKILDAGAGPGFVAMDLLGRVGTTGEITALEPSEMYVNYARDYAKENNIPNMKVVHGTVETAELPREYYDVIFARWVISFVPDADTFLEKLFASLKPGGIIAFMDYAYEGLALFPKGGAFDKMADAVRAYWVHGGGDPYIGARLPKMFRERNIDMKEYYPVAQCGGPSSGVFQWADKFFTVHIQQMVDLGIISQNNGDAMLADWNAHKQNKDSVFISPTITVILGKK